MRTNTFRILAAGLLISGASASFGQTATLTAEEIMAAITEQTSASAEAVAVKEYRIDAGDLTWTLTLETVSGSTLTEADFGFRVMTGDGFLCNAGNGQVFTRFSLSTDDLSDLTVTSATILGGLHSYEMTGPLSYTLTVGDATVTQTAPETWMRRGAMQPLTLEAPADASGRFEISAVLDGGGTFSFKYLNVRYSGTAAAQTRQPRRDDELQTGHIIRLSCPDPEATIYYSLNGAPESTYDPACGIVLAEAGRNELTYYAQTSGLLPSPKTVETYDVFDPSGLDYVRAIYAPVPVSGFVIAQGEGYTLIGAIADAPLSECLALDNADFRALAAAAPGDFVKAQGLPTDRFGRAALGSLSEVSINGVSAAISRVEAEAKSPAEGPVFDLQGRPASANSRATILISPGRKELVR